MTNPTPLAGPPITVTQLHLSAQYTMLGFSQAPPMKLSAYPTAKWLGPPSMMNETNAWRYMHLLGTVWRCYPPRTIEGDPGDEHATPEYDGDVMIAFATAIIALGNPRFIIIMPTPND